MSNGGFSPQDNETSGSIEVGKFWLAGKLSAVQEALPLVCTSVVLRCVKGVKYSGN